MFLVLQATNLAAFVTTFGMVLSRGPLKPTTLPLWVLGFYISISNIRLISDNIPEQQRNYGCLIYRRV